MGFDGSGNFSRSYNWVSDRDNGINILATRMDGEFDNFSGGMNLAFLRNGLVPMSGALAMGTNSITGLGSGTAGSPAIRFTDDASTGVFLNGTGDLRFSVAGTSRLSLTAAGAAVTGLISATGNVSGVGLRDSGALLARFEGTGGGGAPTNATGPGIEISQGIIAGYNRTTMAAGPIAFNASAITFNPAVTFVAGITGTTATFSSVVKSIGFLDSGAVLARFEGTGGGVPAGATGPGIEIAQGLIQAYNRTGAAFGPLEIIGSTVKLSPGGALPGNYANDAAAAIGGIPVGAIYRNGSVLMVRAV